MNPSIGKFKKLALLDNQPSKGSYTIYGLGYVSCFGYWWRSIQEFPFDESGKFVSVEGLLVIFSISHCHKFFLCLLYEILK